MYIIKNGRPPLLSNTCNDNTGLSRSCHPAIDAGRREKGRDRNKIYSAIAFGALILAISIIIFRVLTGEVLPAVAFSQEVVVDDMFGSFFAIALLIVSIMVTASSWNYYKGKSNPAILFSVTPLQYWHGDHCVFDRPCNAIGRMGADVASNLCTGRLFKA